MSWENLLRADLRQLANRWAETSKLPYYRSRGKDPTVLFETGTMRTSHGNFLSSSWAAIQADPNWLSRLGKSHSRRSALPVAKQLSACELDSSNSSDALLMNCFCIPHASNRILTGLGLLAQREKPRFGFKAKVRLNGGQLDETEVDMKLGSLFVEAKLTEKDFTKRPIAHVERYQDLTSTFHVEWLPRKGDYFLGYQLIRNVLAARQHQVDLLVLVDQRRPDLLEEWWTVHSAIREADLRARCGFRTWQQVRASSPPVLATFLTAKYGL